MSWIIFQNPSALFFVPLAALPLVIHLFRHHKAKVLPFPSIILLKSTHTRTWQRSRLQEWLLLLTRMILLLLLVLLTARPSANFSLPGWLAARQASLVMIIDNSASMSTIKGDSSLMAMAKASSAKFVSGLDSESRVAVICGSKGNELLCGLSSPKGAADRIKSMEQTTLGTDLAGAVIKADEILSSAGGGASSVVIYSDFRKNSFNNTGISLPELRSTVQLNLVETALERPGKNLEWRSVRFYPLKKRLIIQGKTGQETEVELLTEGKILLRSKIRPDTAGNFSTSLYWEGFQKCFLECSKDDMPLDDRYYLPSGKNENVSVLLSAEESGILTKAFAALSAAGYKLTLKDNPNATDIFGSDLIVVAGKRISGIGRTILAAVNKGAGLLVIPPENALAEDYNKLLSGLSPDLVISGISSKQAGKKAQGLEFGTERLFSDISSRDLRHINVYKYWQTNSKKPALLTIGNKDKGLLMVDYGEGKAAIWLFGTESGMTDAGFHPVFLTAINQVCQNILRTDAEAYQTGQYLTGYSKLTGPSGKKALGIAGEQGGIKWLLSDAGHYVGSKGISDLQIAANIPAEESNLLPLEEKEIKQIMGKNKWNFGKTAIKQPIGITNMNNIFFILIGLFLMLELALRSKLKIFLKNPLTTQ
jgi:hypothetical protein